MAVNFDGGSAVDPLLPGHPLSKGVTMAMINMHSNFFTVEFLAGGLIQLRYSRCRFATMERISSNVLPHSNRYQPHLKITKSYGLERRVRYMTLKKNGSNIVTRYYQ